MLKYSSLLNAKVVDVADKSFNFKDADVIAYALPIPFWLERVAEVQKVARNVVCMTICETEMVHEDYGKLFKLFDNPILVPSDFCKKVFSRQFPGSTFNVVRHWEPMPKKSLIDRTHAEKYRFYHIGNIIDHRKQVGNIIKAFQELNLPNSELILKATCSKPVELKIPNVLVINGLLSKDQIDNIHDSCDCYVSFSHSEGVGMGAVEAALRDKPVITADYGGAVEYINTKYLIKCKLKTVGVDDFLYKSYMIWGDPNYESLKKYMKDAYDNKVRYVDHEYTKILLERETIRSQLIESLSRPKDQQSKLLVQEHSAEHEEESPCRQQAQSQWVVL